MTNSNVKVNQNDIISTNVGTAMHTQKKEVDVNNWDLVPTLPNSTKISNSVIGNVKSAKSEVEKNLSITVTNDIVTIKFSASKAKNWTKEDVTSLSKEAQDHNGKSIPLTRGDYLSLGDYTDDAYLKGVKLNISAWQSRSHAEAVRDAKPVQTKKEAKESVTAMLQQQNAKLEAQINMQSELLLKLMAKLDAIESK